MEFEKIKKIKKVQSEPVYHINVKNNHNFFANNLCVHNCDYYNNVKNEGEMFVKIHNHGDKDLVIPKGEAFAQAIFNKYLVTDTDSDTHGGQRIGGIGSTSSTGPK